MDPSSGLQMLRGHAHHLYVAPLIVYIKDRRFWSQSHSQDWSRLQLVWVYSFGTAEVGTCIDFFRRFMYNYVKKTGYNGAAMFTACPSINYSLLNSSFFKFSGQYSTIHYSWNFSLPIGIIIEHNAAIISILLVENMFLMNCNPSENPMTTSWHMTAPNRAQTSAVVYCKPTLMPRNLISKKLWKLTNRAVVIPVRC